VVPHLRGGAAGGSASTDTLQSMFQAEPFILPAEYNPYAENDERAPLTTQRASASIARPSLVARVSSSRNDFLGDLPIGGAILGVHGAPPPPPPPARSAALQGAMAVDRKESIGPHGEAPSRTPSGHTIPPAQRTGNRGMPPPITTGRPTRVTRDSEDFSPISPDEDEHPPSSPFLLDPFRDGQEAVVDIPPTYHSVQAVVTASRRNSVLSQGQTIEGSSAEAEAGHEASWVAPMTRSLSRSNAISHSRRTRRSTRSFQGYRSDDAHMGN